MTLTKKTTKHKKGFTLIELLIVVMLIGILSGVVLSVLNVRGLRAKARDAQRIGDLKKIQAALELYFSDNRQYPYSAAFIKATAIPGLSPAYLSKIPSDPTQTATPSPCADENHDYLYKSDGNGSTIPSGKYVISAGMEVDTSDDASTCTSLGNWTGVAACAVTAGVNCYGVQNPL